MKAIICGAGQAGKDIAEYLADEDDDITLIDTDTKVLAEITDGLDVRGVIGYGSYPNVLRDAGAENADMIVAVTPIDELNMITCLVADNLFKIPLKIARIRTPEYVSKSWSGLYKTGGVPIDVLVSPEMEMAKSIARTLRNTGALEVVPLSDEKVYLIALKCRSDSVLFRTEVSNVTMVCPDLSINIVAIVRANRALKPYPDEQIQDKDVIYFLVPAEQVAAALSAFGYEEVKNQKIIVTGAGRITEYLMKFLLDNNPFYTITVIEKDEQLARKMADMFDEVNVINGDYLEPEILEEAGIRETNTAIALTEFDEDNILLSLLAKNDGVGTTFALVNKLPYHNLVASLGVDIILDTKSEVVSSIIPYVRRGSIKKAYAVRGGRDEMLEIGIEKSSRLRGKKVSSLDLPKGAFFGGILRDGSFLISTQDTIFKLDDILYVWARHYAIKDIEKLFALRKEIF